MVETQLRKLRDKSDTFVRRAYFKFHLYYGVCELNLRYPYIIMLLGSQRDVQMDL